MQETFSRHLQGRRVVSRSAHLVRSPYVSWSTVSLPNQCIVISHECYNHEREACRMEMLRYQINIQHFLILLCIRSS